MPGVCQRQSVTITGIKNLDRNERRTSKSGEQRHLFHDFGLWSIVRRGISRTYGTLKQINYSLCFGFIRFKLPVLFFFRPEKLIRYVESRQDGNLQRRLDRAGLVDLTHFPINEFGNSSYMIGVRIALDHILRSIDGHFNGVLIHCNLKKISLS